jgi:LysR family transcriptional regulator, regulator for metE and metH
MLRMVASETGVAAMPRWLAEEYAGAIDVIPLRLGRAGLAKQIFLGVRKSDLNINYLAAFIALARGPVAGAADESKSPSAVRKTEAFV